MVVHTGCRDCAKCARRTNLAAIGEFFLGLFTCGVYWIYMMSRPKCGQCRHPLSKHVGASTVAASAVAHVHVGTVPGPAQPYPSAVAAGWHPDPYGGGGLRFWDGTTWTTHTSAAPSQAQVATPTPTAQVVAAQPAGWYPDPGGGPGQRWWDGSSWTSHTDEPQKLAPAVEMHALPAASQPVRADVPDEGWHPDPADPSQLRWWDGSDWTDHTTSAG